MAKLIFTKIYDSLSDVVTEIKEKSLRGQDVEDCEKKKQALVRVLKYALQDDSWLSHKTSREKVRYFIQYGCDYEQTMKHFQAKSRNSVESSMSVFGKKFAETIGVDTVDLILAGHVEEAMKQFNQMTKKVDSSDIYLKGVMRLLPKPKKKYFPLEDCKEELKLLRLLTTSFLEQHTKQFDENKIAYLLYILASSEKGIGIERSVLQDLLKGEYSQNKYGNILTLNEQVSKTIEEYLKMDFLRHI